MGARKSSGKNPPKGHVRRGKKLIPEFLAQFPMNFIRHTDVVLPEVLPIALLHDDLDAREANRVAHELLAVIRSVKVQGSLLASDLEALTVKEGDTLRSRLSEMSDLQGSVSSAFAPLNTLFDRSPLKVFETKHLVKSVAERRLRECVDAIFYRGDIQTARVLATLYYVEARAGRLKIADTMRLPDLESLYLDPEGEAAQRAAAEVRMFSLMKIGHQHEQSETDWPQRFWHACRSIGPCEIATEND